MTDLLASSSHSDRSQTISSQTQKPIKSLSTSVVNDDEKYESDHASSDKVSVQVSKPKQLSSSSLPADDSKDQEVASDSAYALAPETEQADDASYSQLQSTKQDDSIDYVADVYPEYYSQEMESALVNVRKLASFQQEVLVNSICDTFSSFNGREPSINDLSAIFERIQSQLASEASVALAESEEASAEDAADSDYDEFNVSDRVQASKDLSEDYEVSYIDESDLESDDPDDADYNPSNFADLNQATVDEQEDIFDSAEPLLLDDTFAEEVSEEDTIDGINFDTQYFDAIKSVQLQAKSDATSIIENVFSDYSDEYTEDALAEIVATSFAGLASYELDEIAEEEEDDESKQSELESSEVDDSEYVDSDVLASEMELALSNVRKLASFQQEEFIVKISDLYSLYNGSAPSVYDLAEIFSGIKQEFADEAVDEILEDVDADLVSEDEEGSEEDGASDSDYDPSNESDLKQASIDEEEDYSSAEEADAGIS